MKLCKDCKHIKFYGYGRNPVCVHPAAPFDPVTGEKDGSCSLMRSRNCCIEQCGVDGDWFEQAPPPEPARDNTNDLRQLVSDPPPRKTWFARVLSAFSAGGGEAGRYP